MFYSQKHSLSIIYIIIFFLIFFTASAQRITYKGNAVDTLKIVSSYGYYHFDTAGTSTGTTEEYFFVFDPKRNNYFYLLSKQTDYKNTYRPELTSKTEKLRKHSRRINRQRMAHVISTFEAGSIERTFASTGMVYKEFLKLTSRKRILRIAKKNDLAWTFSRSYNGKGFLDTLFRGYQNLDTFNLYLSSAFDSTKYGYLSDVHGSLQVYIVTNKESALFVGNYENLFYQPWCNLSDTSNFPPPCIVNLAINKSLLAFFPKKLSRDYSLHYYDLTKQYLIWYSRRRGVDLE